MQTVAIKAFSDWFINKVPNAEMYLNWPGPHIRLKFPYFALVLVHSRITRWENQFLQSKIENSKDIQYFSNGQWESRVDLHYFSKDSELEDQNLNVEKIDEIFNSQFASDQTGSSNLIIPFGDLDGVNMSVTLVDYQLQQTPEVIQSGERRAIISLLMDIPSIVKTELPLVKTLPLDAYVGEKVSIL